MAVFAEVPHFPPGETKRMAQEGTTAGLEPKVAYGDRVGESGTVNYAPQRVGVDTHEPLHDNKRWRGSLFAFVGEVPLQIRIPA